MLKKVFTIIIFFACMAKVSAQIEVHSSNQVGIGTTNPQYKLHVVGNAFVSGNFLLGSASNFLQTNFPNLHQLNNSLTGSNGNVFFGPGSLFSNTTGYNNTAHGYDALRSNTTGYYNTAHGYEALLSNTTSRENTAVGYHALRYNTGGIGNTAVGSRSLYSNSTSGNWNTAVGVSALENNTVGFFNTAISGALVFNTTGSYNTAYGYGSLYSNTSASQNTASGYYALFSNTGGTRNTAHGYYALYNNTLGLDNTAIGTYALLSNTTGQKNTAIGYGASVASGGLINTTAIGNEATVTASNQVRIGNTIVNSIGGYAAWTNVSDGRAKKNIRADVPGLAFINGLQPITYNLDLDAVDALIKYEKPERNDLDSTMVEDPMLREFIEMERKAREAKEKQVQTGFVAQDVEKTAKSIGYEFSGVDVDETGVYGLRYAEFVVPLVKSVQELSEQNNRLQERINELSKRVEALEKKNNFEE